MRSRFHVFNLALPALLLVFTLAGCKKTAPPEPAPAPRQVQTIEGGPGADVFNANGCGRCHAVNGRGGRRGPDLSKVGAEDEHTVDWLIAHIKNPKQHKPDSRMPAFEGKISESDLKVLAEFLAGLK